MLPEQPGTVRNLKLAKPVFYCVNMNIDHNKNNSPFGTIPMICEGGGRFDSDLLKAGWQEDSFWVGGYFGPQMEVDLVKVKAAIMHFPPGTHYCFNVEHWKSDLRNSTPEQVEDTIRRFRIFFIAVEKLRPDMRWSLYSIAPAGEYWTPYNYQIGLNAWEKLQTEGIEKMSDFDRWCVSHVASNKTGYNNYIWDETTETQKAFKAWQDANYRLVYGINNKGKQVTNWGLTDVLDYLCPSVYDPYKNDDPEAYIKWNCLEAKRIGGGKKVYPFVWPRYHNSNPTDGLKTIPLDEWRQHLRLCFKYADGICIWAADPEHREHINVALDEAERSVSGRPDGIPVGSGFSSSSSAAPSSSSSSPTLNPDFNKDGKVDFDDLLILAQNYGKPGFDGGDANADGKVDFDDLLLLAQRYGSSSSSTK